MLPLFNDLADRVVAKRIRDKLDEVVRDLIYDSLLLARSFSQCDNDFNNAQSILIQAQIVQLGVNFIKYEGLLLLIKAFALEYFPNDMCTLLIDREIVDVSL